MSVADEEKALTKSCEPRCETGAINPRATIGAGVAIGIGGGKALGAATDDMSIGIAIGAGLGIALEAALSKSQS